MSAKIVGGTVEKLTARDRAQVVLSILSQCRGQDPEPDALEVLEAALHAHAAEVRRDERERCAEIIRTETKRHLASGKWSEAAAALLMVILEVNPDAIRALSAKENGNG